MQDYLSKVRYMHSQINAHELDTVKPQITDPTKIRLSLSVQRTDHLPPIDFTIELKHFEPLRSRHLYNGH